MKSWVIVYTMGEGSVTMDVTADDVISAIYNSGLDPHYIISILCVQLY